MFFATCIITYIGSSLISWTEAVLGIKTDTQSDIEALTSVIKSKGFYYILSANNNVYKATDLLATTIKPTFVGVEKINSVLMNIHFFVSSGIPIVTGATLSNPETPIATVVIRPTPNKNLELISLTCFNVSTTKSVGSFNYATGEILVNPSMYSYIEYEAFTIKSIDNSTYFSIGEISWE